MASLVEHGVEELRVHVHRAEDLLRRAEGLHHILGQRLASAVVAVYPGDGQDFRLLRKGKVAKLYYALKVSAEYRKQA